MTCSYHEFYVLYPIGFVSELCLWYLIVRTLTGPIRLWCLAYVAYRLLSFPTNYLRMIRISDRALSRKVTSSLSVVQSK